MLIVDDVVRLLRATVTNLIAIVAPRYYLKRTGQTGRDESGVETVDGIVAYFETCFDDYFRVLDVPRERIEGFLSGKTVLEYGPGDLPGVALLMVAHGAERVICVDRFPMISGGDKNASAMRRLGERLPPREKSRMAACFLRRGDPASGFDPARIDYRIRPNGLSGLSADADMIISRAVLEHVNDPYATFLDIECALKPGSLAVHLVDLKSHGLHRSNPLDFLTWPMPLWNLMYSHKGVPNRWRVDRYRDAIARTGLSTEMLAPTLLADNASVRDVRPHLAKPFRGISDVDLAWLGFWLVCRKPHARRASAVTGRSIAYGR